MCRKLKDIYFNGQSWEECHMKIANKFTDLKKVYRKYCPEKTELEVLTDLSNFCEKDYHDSNV